MSRYEGGLVRYDPATDRRMGDNKTKEETMAETNILRTPIPHDKCEGCFDFTWEAKKGVVEITCNECGYLLKTIDIVPKADFNGQEVVTK